MVSCASLRVIRRRRRRRLRRPPLAGHGNNKPAQPEIKVQYDVANGNVFIKFSNKGGGIARLTVTDNAYGARTRPVLVPAGAHIEEAWVLASSHHWYDLTVTSNDDASFSRSSGWAR